MRQRILQWLGKAPTLYPALFRILDENGQPVDSVNVHAEYLPSGQSIRERRMTAQGLCIFAWPKLARQLRLTVRGEEGSARIEVEVARVNPEQVIELALRAS